MLVPRARDTQDTNLLSLQARRHWSVHVEQHGPVPGVTATDRMGNSEVDCRKNLHTRKRVRGKTRNLRTNERREALPERRPRPVFNRTGHFSGQNVGMQRMSPQSDARLRRRQGETPSDGFQTKRASGFFTPLELRSGSDTWGSLHGVVFLCTFRSWCTFCLLSVQTQVGAQVRQIDSVTTKTEIVSHGDG